MDIIVSSYMRSRPLIFLKMSLLGAFDSNFAHLYDIMLDIISQSVTVQKIMVSSGAIKLILESNASTQFTRNLLQILIKSGISGR